MDSLSMINDPELSRAPSHRGPEEEEEDYNPRKRPHYEIKQRNRDMRKELRSVKYHNENRKEDMDGLTY